MKDFERLMKIVGQFSITGHISLIEPMGTGLINDTYRVLNAEAGFPDYVLQRINHAIFTDVEMLQNNIQLVTDHIRRKLVEQGETDIDRKVLRFLPVRETGKTYLFDGTDYWRLMLLIPRAKTYETVNPEYSYRAGLAFGQFQTQLSDMPEQPGEIIPHFHDMEYRLMQLREAVKGNAAGRVSEVQYYLDEIEKRADEMCKAERMHREGILPKRVCHCDTKVNNMMFDEEGKVLCIIDLDTVMPNYIFSDYGDFLRTSANTGREDDEDLEQVNFNMEIFKAFTKGYLEGASFLTTLEIENLPFAATLFPYMQCVRFLADYINGDTYYKIKYPLHNLVRTKAQFRLMQSAEAHLPKMRAFISDCLK